MTDDVEKFSVVRAVAAIERCDVALLVIDATEGVTEQDKKIAGIAHEAGKGIIVVVNKWDLVAKETNTMRDFERRVKGEMVFMSYAPVLFTSALKGQRLPQGALNSEKKKAEVFKPPLFVAHSSYTSTSITAINRPTRSSADGL